MIISNVQLKKLQKIELMALDKFHNVCQENNLNYSLTGGTLLGAIRHHGFIPWDDDADVVMTRSDFNKLRNLPSDVWGEKFFYQSSTTDINYRYTYDKLRVNGTFFGEKALQNTDIKNNGIFIDIFPIDTVPDNYKQNIQLFNFGMLRLLFMAKYINIDYRKGIEKQIAKFLRMVTKNVSIEYLQDKIEHTITRYDTENFLRKRSFASFNARKEIYYEKYLTELIDAEFESRKYKISKYYDDILTNLYGDYMKLPSESERINKHEVTKLDFGKY